MQLLCLPCVRLCRGQVATASYPRAAVPLATTQVTLPPATRKSNLPNRDSAGSRLRYACTYVRSMHLMFFRWPWGLGGFGACMWKGNQRPGPGRQAWAADRQGNAQTPAATQKSSASRTCGEFCAYACTYVHTVDGELSSQHQPNQSTAGRLGRGRRCCPCAVCCLPFQLPQTLPVAYDPRIWNWTTHSHTRTVDTDASSFLILMVARYSRLARRPEYLTPHPRGHGAHLSSRPAGLASAASH